MEQIQDRGNARRLVESDTLNIRSLPKKMMSSSVKNFDSQHMLRVFIIIGCNFA